MTLDLDRLSPFAAMENMNMNMDTVSDEMNHADTDRMEELGFVTWASSDEDGGPDVGITVGLGPELGHLWLGEITRDRFESDGCDQYADNDMGWWLMHYKPKGEPFVIGKLLSEDYQAREFFENTLAPLLGSRTSTPPASPVVGEDAVRNAHVGVLKYWKNELAQTHTPLMATAEPTSIGYIAWFIESAIDIAPSLPLTKLARWVGFIQGILASHNYLNVNSERDRTRPIFECERREASIPAPTAGRAEGLEEAAKPFVKYADVLRGQRSQHNTPIVELWDHKLTGQDFINLADALAHQAVTVDDGDLALIWGRHEMRKAFTTRGRMVGQMLTMHDDIETLLAAFPQRREDDAPRYSYARSSGVWAVWDRSTTTCIKQCADENEAEKLCNKLNAQRREE